MFAQSNDLFYAPREEGIALFDASGKPTRGDVTSQILLWDAGTEVNEEPGLGPNQAALQAAPNTGPAEHGVVRPITEGKDGFHYPTVPEVLRVTITLFFRSFATSPPRLFGAALSRRACTTAPKTPP